MEENEYRQKFQRICDLTADLTSSNSEVGDWKIAKSYEYVLLGLDAPYDVNELHEKRQAIRDEINTLKKELEEEDSKK